jgi:hypothetical protein
MLAATAAWGNVVDLAFSSPRGLPREVLHALHGVQQGAAMGVPSSLATM